MRLFLGIVIGIALTIGTAYVHDTKAIADQERLVNWEVARGLAGNAYNGARDQIREWTGY
jgi:hypothetical protein